MHFINSPDSSEYYGNWTKVGEDGRSDAAASGVRVGIVEEMIHFLLLNKQTNKTKWTNQFILFVFTQKLYFSR